jgi:NTE family protein
MITLKHEIPFKSVLCVCLTFTLFSCAQFTAVDKPIEQWSRDREQHDLEQAMAGRSSDLLVMVAFSGGGTRAAAFAYGVLKELAEIQVSTEIGKRPLLQEIDIISSVSGGSFTSAYYALHGEKIFEDFETRFLRKNVQGALIRRELNPYFWIRRMSPAYSKADMVADYYDKYIFDNATFSDFRKATAPLIVINSTDLSAGNRFPFTQIMFDMICADLGSYPVSRAVAASSAVPVLFTPITLKNYAGQCGFNLPKWLAEAAKDNKISSRRVQAQILESYTDQTERPWFHLVDGGISDNLGLRSFYDTLLLAGDPKDALRSILHPHPRRILIISVNSLSKSKTDWAMNRYSPSLRELISSVTSDQIARYSTDTIDIIRYAYNSWAKRYSTPDHPVEFKFVEVSFDAVDDDDERQFLNNIGTSFNLSDKEVDHLIAAARRALRDTAGFKDFLEYDYPGNQ